MNLLSPEQQQVAFDALHENSLLTSRPSSRKLHIPDLAIPGSLSETAFDAWLDTTQVRYDADQAAVKAAYDDRYANIPNAMEGLLGFDGQGEQHSFLLKDLDTKATDVRQQLGSMQLLMPSWFMSRDGDLLAIQGTRPGFDTSVVETKKGQHFVDGAWVADERPPQVVDINSHSLEDLEDEQELHERGMPGFNGPTRWQLDFVAQAATLSGGTGMEGMELMLALPYIGLSRFVVKQALDSEDFGIPFTMNYDGTLEMRLLVEHKTPQRPEVSLNNIKGDLEHSQENFSFPLDIAGEGILNGKPFMLRRSQTEPVPDGAVVMVDDEYGLQYLPAPVLMPASAIITRGYTGTAGLRPAGSNYNHLAVIGRGLAQERPGEFIYFRMPHMNPGSDELTIWDNLKKSPSVTVASDGSNFKILAGEIDPPKF